MGFGIFSESDNAKASVRADRRLWLAADQHTVVDDGDAARKHLLANAGNEIPASEVKRLGLELVEGRVVQKAKQQPEDKMRRPEQHKGAIE